MTTAMMPPSHGDRCHQSATQRNAPMPAKMPFSTSRTIAISDKVTICLLL